ncbi:YlcG family protein [Citrobacter amalonaticus]|uniref:YlcG family protein n=1 Tax=Citrobacter amalonaticus TaxID=35703 RepID=A0ABY0I231_CITAM|nr:YlcG family protein [Citrobacter amalonaticus]MZK92547.1 YlcG family protein [Citrobacter amalonaticus]MZL02255.1 YlcG family protein [Citrobacter amalonaticus]MZL15845.1 YlcG family protein [Citrobacter amalonaticus]MZL24629.1 YlcG family protein [Citrobacter amalonaticus]
MRIYRRPGSVLVDYRILRNFFRIYHSSGAAR